jgi:hypothetical protein
MINKSTTPKPKTRGISPAQIPNPNLLTPSILLSIRYKKVPLRTPLPPGQFTLQPAIHLAVRAARAPPARPHTALLRGAHVDAIGQGVGGHVVHVLGAAVRVVVAAAEQEVFAIRVGLGCVEGQVGRGAGYGEGGGRGCCGEGDGEGAGCGCGCRGGCCAAWWWLVESWSLMESGVMPALT